MTRENDIVSRMFPADTPSVVVVMEPTLMIPPPKSVWSLSPRHSIRLRKLASLYELNDVMCTWITWFASTYSTPIAVWSFLPIELFDMLTPRIEVICGQYVSEWCQFNNEREARARHRADMSIHTVYDADADRVDRLWQLRGSKVPLRGTP